MLDDQSGIEVHVLLSGRWTPCREWSAPLSSRYHSSHGRRVFIEARAEEPFEIHTTVNSNFDWAATKYLLISYRIDGRTVRKVPIFKDDFRSLSRGMSSVHDVCKSCNLVVDGMLQRCALVFHTSQLVDEPEFLSIDEEGYDLSRRGKLEVRVQRVRLSNRKKPATGGVPQQAPQSLLMRPQSNKKVVMENGRSHFTSFVPQGVMFPHHRSGASSERAWEPLRGRAGQRLKFEIYYTSQMFLSREGMIPTTRTAPTDQYAIGSSASGRNNRLDGDSARSDATHFAQLLVGLGRRESTREHSVADIPVIDLTGPEAERPESPPRAIHCEGQPDDSSPRQCRIADIIN